MMRTNGYIRRGLEPKYLKRDVHALPASSKVAKAISALAQDAAASGQVSLSATNLPLFTDNLGAKGDYTLILPLIDTLRRPRRVTITAVQPEHKIIVQSSGRDRFVLHGRKHCSLTAPPGGSVVCVSSGQGSTWDVTALNPLVGKAV